MSYNSFVLMWNITQHNVLHIILNLVYYICYRFEYTQIERYKTNFYEPWPWHQDPQNWRQKVYKSIIVYGLNSNLIPILVFVPLSYSGLMTEHKLDVENLPTPVTLAATILFCMMCEDLTFYCSHRLLH